MLPDLTNIDLLGTCPVLAIFLRFRFFVGDILDTVESGLMPLDLLCDCLGGGRIEHDPDKKKISVYGYSQVLYSQQLYLFHSNFLFIT